MLRFYVYILTNHLLHRHGASVFLRQKTLVDLAVGHGAVQAHALADLVGDQSHAEVESELHGGVHVDAVNLFVAEW